MLYEAVWTDLSSWTKDVGPPPQMMRGPLHDGGGPPRMLGPPPVRARLGMPPPSVFCRLYNLKVKIRDNVEKKDKERHVVGYISSINQLEKPLGRMGAFNATRLEKPLGSSQGQACYQMTRSLDQISTYSNVGNLQYFNVANQVREAPEFGFPAVEMQDTSGQEHQNLRRPGGLSLVWIPASFLLFQVVSGLACNDDIMLVISLVHRCCSGKYGLMTTLSSMRLSVGITSRCISLVLVPK
ncbi:hypothetical protein Tco_0770617 [Tanacetum coccineum]|uniref:Uncharacterized protein n=1 Tax=Tanacetum coccineum TaxID=301880 RepID=A0ABQ4ZE12_9ASTR